MKKIDNFDAAYTSETHALEATRWACAAYPANPTRTNWEEWMSRIRREALNPYKQAIMRNQVTLGMNNNFWPTLSRFALMEEPNLLGDLISPRHVVGLDSPAGIEMLNELFVQVTGHKPKVYDWHNAQRRG